MGLRKQPNHAGQVRDMVRLLTPHPFTSGPLQIGKVHAVHTTPHHSVDIYLTGITRRTGFTATKTLTKKVPYQASYSPTVGDIVWVQRGSSNGILGTTFRLVIGKTVA